jgi:hypothetical protein
MSLSSISSISSISILSSKNINNLTEKIYLVGSGSISNTLSTTKIFGYSYDKNTWNVGEPRIFLVVEDFITDGTIIVAIGVANGNNSFFTIGYSMDDGITWTGVGPSTNKTNTFVNWGSGIAYNPNFSSTSKKFVAVGRGGGNDSITASDDGITWSKSGISNTIVSRGRGITYGNGIFIVVGEGLLRMATSTDGINWNPISTSTDNGVTWINHTSSNPPTIFEEGATNRGWNVAYNGSTIIDVNKPMFVAVGYGNNHIATSHNGTHWIGRGRFFGTEPGDGVRPMGRKVVWSEYHKLWIVIGWRQHNYETNQILTSQDGINWTSTAQITLGGNTFNMLADPMGITCKNEIIMIGGTRRIFEGTFTSSIIISTDAITWDYVSGNLNDVTTSESVRAILIKDI